MVKEGGMSSKGDTIIWSLLKAGGYWSEENLPAKIYLAGALFTGYMFWCFVCPHCFGLNSKVSLYSSLLTNMAVWPISMIKYFATGTPIIIRTKAEREMIERNRAETLRTIEGLGGGWVSFEQLIRSQSPATETTADRNPPSS